MRSSGTAVELSASDLSQSLGCRHLTALNLAVALGRRSPPRLARSRPRRAAGTWTDHEAELVDGLRAQKSTMVDLSG